MKKTLFALFLLSFQVFFYNQSLSAPSKNFAKGGFKSCTIARYIYKSGKLDNKSGKTDCILKLDDKGNQIEMISFDDNKAVDTVKFENKYNSKGLLTQTVYIVRKKLSMKMAYGYDNNGNKISDTSYNESGIATNRSFYVYDKNNFLIEEIHETKIGDDEFIKGSTYYKNDKYGNKIEESAIRSVDFSAEVTAESNLGDKDNGSKAEISNSSKSNYEAVIFENKYDANGNLIRQARKGKNVYNYAYEYKYDSFGNVIEEIFIDEKNKPSSKTIYEFVK